MRVEIVHLFLTGESLVACKCDYLHAWRHDEKRHVKTYLVVARSGGAVRYGVGSYLSGIPRYRYCLEYTL